MTHPDSDNSPSISGMVFTRALAISVTIGVTVAAILVFALAGDRSSMMSHFHAHAPNFAPIIQAPWVIQLHLAAALTALAIGLVILSGVKGTAQHKALGWSWVIAMAVTAFSSFFIQVLYPGHFSLIHLLSGWTMIILPVAIWAIRQRRVMMHARSMTGTFVGGLIIAGLFTFVPGRIMWSVVFG